MKRRVCIFVISVSRAKALEVLPLLGNRGSQQKSARAQRQRNRSESKRILKIRAPGQRQQRCIERMPNPAIRAHGDQRRGVLEGQIGALSLVAAGRPITRAAGNHLSPTDGHCSKKIGSQLPPREWVAPPQRSVPRESAPVAVRTRRSGRSRECVHLSATATIAAGSRRMRRRKEWRATWASPALRLNRAVLRINEPARCRYFSFIVN